MGSLDFIEHPFCVCLERKGNKLRMKREIKAVVGTGKCSKEYKRK